MKDSQFLIILSLLLAILGMQFSQPFPFGGPILIFALLVMIFGVISGIKEDRGVEQT